MAYLYEHKRLDTGEVFYVGIGLKDDPKHKRAHTKSSRNNMWDKITEKTDYEVIIVCDNLSVDEVKEKEIERIKMYGRKNLGTGTLCNLTDGGDGCLGIVFTEEVKKRMSSNSKGFRHTEETKRKISKSKMGELHPAYGKRGSEVSWFGSRRTEETKNKFSEMRKGKKLGSDNPSSRPVLNLETGIYYVSATEAIRDHGLNLSINHFCRMLRGYRKNKTSFIYI